MGIVIDDLKQHFDRARRFDQDRMVSALRAQRLAWTMAGIASVAVGCCGLALAALVPLKTVEPYVIRVDSSTGIVDVVNALSVDKTTYDEAVTRYFAARYVRARDGYVASEAEESFKTVSLMSTSPEQARFTAIYRGGNPESPQNIYGRTGTAKVTVKAISLITKTVVSVRFLRTVAKGEETRTTHWVATLTFQYSNVPLSATDRLINPLGFVVSEYRADPEVVQ